MPAGHPAHEPLLYSPLPSVRYSPRLLPTSAAARQAAAVGGPNKNLLNGVGYAYLHAVLDDHTRIAHTEDLPTGPPRPAPAS